MLSSGRGVTRDSGWMRNSQIGGTGYCEANVSRWGETGKKEDQSKRAEDRYVRITCSYRISNTVTIMRKLMYIIPCRIIQRVNESWRYRKIKFRLGQHFESISRFELDNEEVAGDERCAGNGRCTQTQDSVQLREWDLVRLHLNRIAWRCLTLKMVSVYYLPQSLSSIFSLFPSLYLSSLFSAHRRSFLPRSFERCP